LHFENLATNIRPGSLASQQLKCHNTHAATS
jgi:hypothetical protein